MGPAGAGAPPAAWLRFSAVGERLRGKAAVVVGGGQTPGETIGNGRATALLFAREGAEVLVVDRDADSAQATRRQILDEGVGPRSTSPTS